MKGILFFHTYFNININGVFQVAGTFKIRGFDLFLDVNQGG